LEKTKEMRINAKQKKKIQIGGSIIENVENVTYIGSNVSVDMVVPLRMLI
jgi:hypothetical protein